MYPLRPGAGKANHEGACWREAQLLLFLLLPACPCPSTNSLNSEHLWGACCASDVTLSVLRLLAAPFSDQP